jgi:hypothetical protein
LREAPESGALHGSLAARVAGAAIATRDIGGFADCGLTLFDPWRGDTDRAP